VTRRSSNGASRLEKGLICTLEALSKSTATLEGGIIVRRGVGRSRVKCIPHEIEVPDEGGREGRDNRTIGSACSYEQ